MGVTCVQILFTTLATIAAILVAYEDAETPKTIFATFLGVPLISWLILAALLFPVIRLGDWVVDFTVRIVELIATAAKLDNVHYALIGMSTALKCASFCLRGKHLYSSIPCFAIDSENFHSDFLT